MGEVFSAEKARFLVSGRHALALGGPGSGKTHIALTKARTEIRRGMLLPGQKVLFLSFARSTVARIAEKSVDIVSSAERTSLELNTYHAFAWGLLRAHAYLLNGQTGIRLLSPPEAAAHLTDIDSERQGAEKTRLFAEEGRLHFDLFAGLVSQLLSGSNRLAAIYADAYPIVILDEFQDTNAEEWAMIQQLGRRARLIALADPEQRIYEFRGADPRRIREFLDTFDAEGFDFSSENHRSNGTDIVAFGNDLLRGANKGQQYGHVKVVAYGFIGGKSPLFLAKCTVLEALRRLKHASDSSLAVLVPSKRLMLELSDYLSAGMDGLPPISHDVSMDAEPPALAACVIAALLEGGHADTTIRATLEAVCSHIRGRRGGRVTPKSELDLAGALTKYLRTGSITGSMRIRTVAEVRRIAAKREQTEMTGDPSEDWLCLRSMLEDSSATALTQVASDAKYLRLLHRGSALRTNLGALWRAQGSYRGAADAVRNALVQEHFAAAQSNWRGVHLMTIHKSKGKEFDEVVIYDGLYHRIARDPQDDRSTAQDLLALRVAVTRAIRRVSILTPKKARCPFL